MSNGIRWMESFLEDEAMLDSVGEDAPLLFFEVGAQ